jgi:glycosyltransferase involved in cell wall biosynthesis
MRPYKVLHITRVAHGGVAVVVDQLARGLNRDSYEPLVLFDTPLHSNIRKKLFESDIKTIDLMRCWDTQGSESHNLRRNRKVGRWVEIHFGKRACQSYLFLKSLCELLIWQLPKIRLLIRTFRENDIDLVHTHNHFSDAKEEIIAARITRIPCIAHSHSYPNLNYFDKLLTRFVSAFIYISKHQAKHYIAQGIPRSKGKVIHNGIDMSKFAHSFDDALIRKEFNCKSGEPLIGLVGRIDWWKGHEYFIEAIARVAREIPIVKGLIIGELAKRDRIRNKEYMDRLHSLVRSLNLQDKIIFTGFRSDIPHILSVLNVVVHASSEPEPFGLVVIEGMAAKKPVIGTAAGGVLDIIEHGVNGLLVPCKDSKAMAQAIIQLLSQRQEAQKIAEEARRRVAEKFSLEKQLAAVEDLYSSLLNGIA